MAGKDYNIGRFTEQVTFLKPEVFETLTGARENRWLEEAERDAEVTNYNREQRTEQSALTEGESYLVRTWVVPGAATDWKVRWNNKQYDLAKVVKLTSTIYEYHIERVDLCEG